MARPWKYDVLIEALEDDVLYHTAKVVKYCDELGLFEYSFDYKEKKQTPQEKEYAMKRARSSLSTFVPKHLGEPDGYNDALPPSRVKYPAYLGKAWKAALKTSKAMTAANQSAQKKA